MSTAVRVPVADADRRSADRLVRALTIAIFLQWLGASAILPMLPLFLRQRGGSDAAVGAVMAAYFVAALAFQYPAGRLADRVGRRPVLLGGLTLYALGSIGFLLPVGPAADIGLRALQGAGAGAAEVASLAMISGAVALERRGRAFGSVYGGQLAGMAIGPLVGSLIGVGSMSVIFVAAGAMSMAACIPVLRGSALTRHGAAPGLPRGQLGRPALNRALLGALLTAAALGLTIGVYESCWTLLLTARGAEQWQIGLSWTLFAVPFVAMSRPAGWLADHMDRRVLVVCALVSSITFCALYPFLHSLVWLLALGGVEAIGLAVALPSAQSLLTQSSAPAELGRVQGLFSTSETAAIAVSAAAGGALFAVTAWAPFVFGAAGAAVLVALAARGLATGARTGVRPRRGARRPRGLSRHRDIPGAAASGPGPTGTGRWDRHGAAR